MNAILRSWALLIGSALIVTSAIVQPASATISGALPGPNMLTKCNSIFTCIGGSNAGNGAGTEGVNTGGGVGGFFVSNKNDGIDAQTKSPSLTGRPSSAIYGLDASTDGGNTNRGVSGVSAAGIGVYGQTGSAEGVEAVSNDGVALRAQSSTGYSATSP